jgi:hypothetical protein
VLSPRLLGDRLGDDVDADGGDRDGNNHARVLQEARRCRSNENPEMSNEAHACYDIKQAAACDLARLVERDEEEIAQPVVGDGVEVRQ